MVLSRADIQARIDKRELTFDPPVPAKAIAQASLDLRLGKTFTKFVPSEHMDAVRVTPALFRDPSMWTHQTVDKYYLQPREFVLAHTLEKVYIPNDLVAFVEGRSSWGRVGVSVHVTAPKLDPGFGPATIALEMFNHGETAVVLVPGVHEICQLILLQVSTPLAAHEAYGASSGDIFAKQDKPVPTT